MKILMIAPQPFYAERGTPMNVRLLCEILGQNGHTVDLLVFPTGREIALDNVNVIRLPNVLRTRNIPIGLSSVKIVYDIVAMGYAWGLALAKRYDVIHGIEEGGFLAVLISRFVRAKSIYDMDSCISDQLKGGRHGLRAILAKCAVYTETWAISRCSLVLTVCSALTERAQALFPEAKVVQIEDISITDIAEENGRHAGQVDKLAKDLGIEKGRAAVYTGNLEEYQGIDLLLDAWEVLRSDAKNRSLQLVVIGGPRAKVDHYRKVARRKGIGDAIHWLGPRPIGEMRYWMQLGAVLISPRLQGDNTPLKIYSYMASGRPIVATRLRTHTQVLSEHHAFLAPPEPLFFSQAVAEAFSDREAALAKGKRAQELVASTFSYQVFRKKLLEAYAALEGTGDPVDGCGKAWAPANIKGEQ